MVTARVDPIHPEIQGETEGDDWSGGQVTLERVFAGRVVQEDPIIEYKCPMKRVIVRKKCNNSDQNYRLGSRWAGNCGWDCGVGHDDLGGRSSGVIRMAIN
jgi:hypothetical protein